MSVSPVPSGSNDGPGRRDFPWPWILVGILVPVTGVTAGQAVRRYVWDKRIKVEAELGKPVEIRMTTIEPPEDFFRTSVSILPGDVRFDGPIEVREAEKNDEQ